MDPNPHWGTGLESWPHYAERSSRFTVHSSGFPVHSARFTVDGSRSPICRRRSSGIQPLRGPEGGGGDEGIRTPDPLRAKQVLFQLSYAPMSRGPPDWGRAESSASASQPGAFDHRCGGSWWTRTTDPCLIRAVLSPTELKTRVVDAAPKSIRSDRRHESVCRGRGMLLYGTASVPDPNQLSKTWPLGAVPGTSLLNAARLCPGHSIQGKWPH